MVGGAQSDSPSSRSLSSGYMEVTFESRNWAMPKREEGPYQGADAQRYVKGLMTSQLEWP